MQISRLFEIVYVLLGKKTVTATELSDRFNVSVRTIYRDIETLSGAGIPVYMSRGKGGGISLLDNFVLSKTLLSESEQNEILTALQGLSATDYPEADEVLAKVSLLFNKESQRWIEVDFSDWEGHQGKFDQIKLGVLSKRKLEFDYYSSSGEKTSRVVEPLQLWFKEKAWYLRAFCINRQDNRTFKLSRIKNLRLSDEGFDKNHETTQPEQLQISDKVDEGDCIIGCIESPKFITLVINIDESQAYRVFDDFNENQIVKNHDGSFTVTANYFEDEWVYGYIQSYGCYAEVVHPPHMRDIIIERLHKCLMRYEVQTNA